MESRKQRAKCQGKSIKKSEALCCKYLLEEEVTVTDDVGTIVVFGSTTTTDATKQRYKNYSFDVIAEIR